MNTADREKALEKEHPDTLESIYCLAYLLHQEEHYQEAFLLYQRASAGYEKILGPDHPNTTACLENYRLLEQELSQPPLHPPPS
jgi:Tetratricopeptide repeat